ncbi:MAG: hypothetical protein RM368_27800 [Nostoc sp. DedSLP03]|uniref:hypothetical protein n=1 Tax=Nostoc sp. DedSLP03 TaxID=3075400 RepID=UPI002AD390E3|nr:hypothetical protein [Nostoc sp. DedSLP03]MDZ7968715.1 hypothetical protein [Nostoc sp. DedSLP03]
MNNQTQKPNNKVQNCLIFLQIIFYLSATGNYLLQMQINVNQNSNENSPKSSEPVTSGHARFETLVRKGYKNKIDL